MSANYEYRYVDKPTEDYFCPVSTELLVNANQTGCCGSHLSEEISSKLEEEKKPCPLCNASDLKTTKDLYFRRLVGQVKVYCQNQGSGCKWEGSVTSLKPHLGFGSMDAGDCKYVAVPCPYLCFKHIQRSHVKHHMKDECPKRPYLCNYCNQEGSHSNIINDHLPVCEKFPTRCPNGCDELLCRADVRKHIDGACSLQVVKCEFEFAGCKTTNLHRKDLKKHMEQNTDTHLAILAGYSRSRDREMEGMRAQVQLLTNIVAQHHKKPLETIASNAIDIGFVKPPMMILHNFQELHMKKEYWKSPPFYSYIGGYKMCLVIYPGSESDQHGNEFLGVYLQMMEGEYDDLLKWPFYGKVEIRMLNWHDNDRGHVDRALLDASSYGKENFRLKMVDRVNRNDNSSVWGCGNFIALKNLRLNKNAHTQYLKDDCIKFSILNVSLLE